MVPLGDVARSTGTKAGDSTAPVYSVTKHNGFVRSEEYFKKQVFSRDTSGYKLVSAGDFAYATIHLDEGSIGIAPESALISPMYTAFSVDTELVDPRYLIRYLKSPKALATYDRMGSGSVHRRRSIPFATLAKFRLPLPPLDEQRRIADILDRASSAVGTATQRLDATQRVVLSVWEASSASQANDNHVLGELLAGIDSGWSPKCEARSAVAGEAGVLKLSAVTGGRWRPQENKALTSEAPREKDRVSLGDVLMTRKNTPELVGDVAYVDELPVNVFLPDLIFRLRVANPSTVRPEFLAFLLGSPRVSQQIRALAGGSAKSMSNISQARLKQLALHIPPVEAQDDYIRLLNLQREIVAVANRAVSTAVELHDSLVHRAFKGEL